MGWVAGRHRRGTVPRSGVGCGLAEELELLPFRRKRTTVSPHEAVVLYPSYGFRTSPQFWTVMIQGCVYHQRINWIRRKPVLAVLKRAMKVGLDGEVFFRQRMRQFLVNFSSGRLIDIRLGNQTVTCGPTEAAGLFRGTMNLPVEELSILPPEASSVPGTPRWVDFTALLPAGDLRCFQGTAQLLEDRGISVISDVDDTLKHSNVPNRRDLFHNTFSRDFIPISGMPDLYRECAARGAAFHYVSGSPWQLYEPLAEFWESQGYPRGSFHLKRFRLRESARKLRRMSPQQVHKQTAIEPLLQAYPQRQFVLIGDSGEQDPEIYALFLRERPEQVLHVFIRTVRGRTVDLPRLQQTFLGVPEDRWTAYEFAEEIHEPLLKQVETATRWDRITG